MIDHALFVDMGGAKGALRSLQLIANNLGNSNTIGFKADYESRLPYQHNSNKDTNQTRHYVTESKSHSDFKPGPVVTTGEPLDVAIDGTGFIAVQTKDGLEAYTRAGNLKINESGFLVTAKGDLVLSSRGVVNVPANERVNISENGKVTAKMQGQNENELIELGQLKIIDLPINQIEKGEDGLFYNKTGAETKPLLPNQIKLITKSLEGSNVNPMRALTDLIDVSRNFEMHTKLMKTVEENSNAASRLLDVSEG